MFLNCLFVGLGGFVGSVLRYLVGFIPTDAVATFPIKTLAINIVGSFVIGLVCALASKLGATMNPQLLLFLKVGLCGGFTTFSTFALESNSLIQAGNTPLAVLYAVGLPYMAVILNLYMGRAMDFTAILWAGMLPFLPGDMVKIAVTAALAPLLQKRLSAAS